MLRCLSWYGEISKHSAHEGGIHADQRHDLHVLVAPDRPPTSSPRSRRWSTTPASTACTSPTTSCSQHPARRRSASARWSRRPPCDPSPSWSRPRRPSTFSLGRAWFGIGAGSQQAEADAMGVPLAAIADRFDAVEDAPRARPPDVVGRRRPFAGHARRAGRPIGSKAPAPRRPGHARGARARPPSSSSPAGRGPSRRSPSSPARFPISSPSAAAPAVAHHQEYRS
jgi:hypothetical protein